MNKQFLFGVWLLCYAFLAQSQYDSTYFHHRHLPQKLNVKVDFANVINPVDPSLLVSAEYFLHRSLSTTIEGGLVADLRTDETNTPFFGWKGRLELRWYFYDATETSARFYLSGNFLYRYLEMEDRYTLGYDCDTGDCQYYKNFYGKIKTDRYSLLPRLGVQDRLSKRIILEVDGGLGVQYLDLRRTSIDGGRFMESGRYFDESDFRQKPHISLSCKLGFVLY